MSNENRYAWYFHWTNWELGSVCVSQYTLNFKYFSVFFLIMFTYTSPKAPSPLGSHSFLPANCTWPQGVQIPDMDPLLPKRPDLKLLSPKHWDLHSRSESLKAPDIRNLCELEPHLKLLSTPDPPYRSTKERSWGTRRSGTEPSIRRRKSPPLSTDIDLAVTPVTRTTLR